MPADGAFKPKVLFDIAFPADDDRTGPSPALPRVEVIADPAVAGPFILRLAFSLRPDLSEPFWPLVVRLGEALLFDGPVLRGVTLGFRLPQTVVERLPDLSLEIAQPDRVDGMAPPLRLCSAQLLQLPARPCRPALADVAAMDDKAVVSGFESLGDNCEFGMVQRSCGAEPLGLFRFSSLGVDNLLIGLATGFRGVPAREQIEPFLAGPPGGRREYLIHQKAYDMVYHTGVSEGELTPQQLIARELTKLQYLRRRLLEDLEDAEKIFVCRRTPALSEPEMLAVLLAVRAYGPNTVLWAVPADDAHAAGTVEPVMDGLMTGYVDRLTTYENATDVSVESWLSVCRGALALASGP